MKYCRAVITKSLNATIILNAERIILSKHVLTLDHVIANLVKKGERVYVSMAKLKANYYCNVDDKLLCSH